MRRMSGTGNHRHFDRTIAFFLRNLDLTNGAVLIVGALQDRERYPDVGEIVRNIPVTKLEVEPRVIPTVEGVVDIAVPALQLLLKASGLIGVPGVDFRGLARILGNEMRRDHRHGAHAMILQPLRRKRIRKGVLTVLALQAAAKADLVEQL